MSDFIPPLISASPPPMPDFDDEDDDDVEFGIGCAIGDLDFSVTPDDDSNEKKDKILEIENRRLEIGVTTNNWKCEEQDSTSQDSGLCMASQSSEGMSPLPQSDDEDKNNLDHNHVHEINDEVSNNSMKHSSTVMFNKSNETNDKEISNNTTIAFDNNQGDDNVGSQTISLSDEVLPTDTGQNNTRLNREIESDTDFNTEHEKSNFNNESDSDSEFVWNSTVDNDTDLFNSHDKEVFVNNDYDKNITANHDTSEIIVNHDSTILNHPNNLFVSSKETSVSNEHPVNEVSPSTTIENINNESSSTSHSVKCESVNNICDSSFNNFNVINDVDQSIKCLNNDDDFDEDDFGNFASVTIPDCDSSINNNNNNSESDNNFSEFTSSSSAVVPTDESDEKDLKSDLESNTTDLEPKSDDIVFNNSSPNVSDLSSSVLNKDSSNSCPNKSDNLNTNECSDNKDFNEDDDEFDDFSDFTQSSDLPVSYQKPEILKSEQSTIDQTALMNQDSFDRIFPKLENTYSEVHVDNLEGGPVWKHLSSLENSPALTFQWSNSKAHNKLLAALSIDSRNILFGPHWNTNIPRFAANLCANPLQPIKAVEPNPGFSSSSPIPPSSDEPAVVPDAHFDWVSSGLTNPLDCTSEKLSSNNIEIERVNDGSKPSSTVDNLNILSNEAESIISLLPDLNFMKKTYIEILISKG